MSIRQGYLTIKLACLVSGICAGLIPLAQLPAVSERAAELKDWPAVAILGLISITSLGLVYYIYKDTAKSLLAQMQVNADAQIKAVQALDRLINKLDLRPCLRGRDAE